MTETFTDDEVFALRSLLAGSGSLPGLTVDGQLRVNQFAPESALFVYQGGPATAAQVVTDAPNPALRLNHRLNRNCLELAAADPAAAHDVVDAALGDVRTRQVIAHTVNVGRDPRPSPNPAGSLGAVAFVDPADQRPSPDFHWALKMDASQAVHLGNPDRPQSVRIRTGAGFIDFEAGGVLQARIGPTGVWVRNLLQERP